MNKTKNNRYKTDPKTAGAIPEAGLILWMKILVLHPNERDAMFAYMQSISKDSLLTVDES